MNKFAHSVRIRCYDEHDLNLIVQWCQQQWPEEYQMTWGYHHVAIGWTCSRRAANGVMEYAGWHSNDFVFAHQEQAAAFMLVWSNWKV